VKVVVLTTSYPRFAGDGAGRFVADAVDRIRKRGVEVEVVAPTSFRHFGIAYGAGVVGNLRRAPWKGLLLPAMLALFVRAARRAARDADLVHAHWLPAGAVGLATGKPVIVQLWGTDVELARRVPWLARAVLRRARLVVCASTALASEAARLGSSTVRVLPSGVELPDRVGDADDPPHALFVGRLSPEKGILDFLEASGGMPRRIVGDGPLRPHVPEAVGFVPHSELGTYYDRAAVLACPSRREGYGVVVREAMAHGRPVVAAAVGGLLDAVVDGETGLLVPPGDVPALRRALERLLGDGDLRARMGAAARERARALFSDTRETELLLAAYRDAAGASPRK
jgi:glycosyltransferase involved in cell wall biosynthesis